MKNLLQAFYYLFVPGALERTMRYHFRKQQELKNVAITMGLDDSVHLANLAQFLTICLLDIIQLNRHILFAWPSWTKKLHSRHLMLAIHELADDMSHLLGNPLREIIARGPTPNKYLEQLKQRRESLALLLRNYRQHILDVRTICAAHRDHDATLLLQTIDSINVPNTRDLAIRMQEWCSLTIRFLNAVTTDYNKRKIEELTNVMKSLCRYAASNDG